MLPAPHRMRRGRDFDAAVKRGRRSGRRTLVVHAARVDVVAAPGSPAASVPVKTSAATPPARVGFVVSRAVGSAVVRTRVKRRLRALLAARIDGIPPGILVVVRANPAAAAASSQVLASDLEVALPRALHALASRDELEPGRLAPAGDER
ncbi:MAG TPA: ribonuclease P protein component [Kineosporiaceae bacterium]|nr:ribonuclease P protein component [Kineosporiaceae bacterium]